MSKSLKQLEQPGLEAHEDKKEGPRQAGGLFLSVPDTTL